jgi:hypothetical protein
MARPKSEKIRQAREHLETQIREGYFPAGSRFLSARALSARHGMSYQSAHRLLAGLASAGLLERREGSGTYVAGAGGQRVPRREVVLYFHARARRPASFGARLLEVLHRHLPETRTRFGDPGPLNNAELPVIWEDATTLEAVMERRQYAVLLNEAPPPGLAATLIDSVMVDDFSGGVVAGEIARDAGFTGREVLMFAGPESDYRGNDRLRGFQEIFPNCAVLFARSWYREEAVDDAAVVLAQRPALVFCANDGLAEAVLEVAARRGVKPPALIGFDDAPLAASRGLTTIAIPWAEFAEMTMGIIQSRLKGSSQTATRRILLPRPVLRGSHHRQSTH